MVAQIEIKNYLSQLNEIICLKERIKFANHTFSALKRAIAKYVIGHFKTDNDDQRKVRRI